MARSFETCETCDGSGGVCVECDEPCNACACDEPDINDCEACNGAGEVPCDPREDGLPRPVLRKE